MSSGDFDLVCDQIPGLTACGGVPLVCWWEAPGRLLEQLCTTHALSVSQAEHNAFGCLWLGDLAVPRGAPWAVWGVVTLPSEMAGELGRHGIGPGCWPGQEVGGVFPCRARGYAAVGHPWGVLRLARGSLAGRICRLCRHAWGAGGSRFGHSERWLCFLLRLGGTRHGRGWVTGAESGLTPVLTLALGREPSLSVPRS